ncbi:hypothetical protein DVH05_015732 [Phytophthora capsici]|nr:hypothetical protein DVH05_015732 [Phytophthora capsici]
MGASKSSKAPASSPPSPAPAAATSTKDAELVKQIAALIVPEMTSSTEERLKENAQREFWTEMRELLSVNQCSSGLFVLDQLAEALLDNASTENKEMAFTDPVMLLPKPSRQREAPNAYVHNRFSNTQDLPDVNVNSAPVIFGQGTPFANIPSPVKPQRRRRRNRQRRKPPPKHCWLLNRACLRLKGPSQSLPLRHSASASRPPSRTTSRRSSSPNQLQLPRPDYCPYVMTDSTPPTLLQDVEGVYRRAVNMGKTCQELDYPWEGSKVWYDPV